MAPAILDSTLIPDPAHWRLGLRLDTEGSALTALIYCPGREGSLMLHTLPYAAGEGTPLKALEETVYANPLLVADFARVTIVVDTPRRLFLPVAEAADDLADTLMQRAFGDEGADDTVLLSPLAPLPDVTEAWGIPAALAGFLRRTFFNATIAEHLAPLCRYHASRGRGMMVNLRPSSLDVVVVEGGALLLSNTFRYEHADDAVYYILAVRRLLDIPADSPVTLAGDPEERRTLTPALQRFVANVLPAPFPSEMFHAGHQAMQAPFDLITALLCE